MKYGKFVGKKYLPFTQREIDYFVCYFKNLIKKYDDSLKLRVEETEWSLTISFQCPEKRVFRNSLKSRVIFKGIGFQIYKQKGYLDNWDWCNNKLIDPSKARENYQDAPRWQYSSRMLVFGSEIPYRCRNKFMPICNGVKPNFLYGTEFDDLDYNGIVKSLFQNVLCPIGEY